jgi:hypothetical protein
MSVYADCDECGNPATDVVCHSCAKGRTHDCILEWVTKERLKVGTDITPEIAAIFERCAEDLS